MNVSLLKVKKKMTKYYKNYLKTFIFFLKIHIVFGRLKII